MSLPFSKIRHLVILITFTLLIGGVGYRLGERQTSLTITPERKLIVNQAAPENTQVDFALFWDVWGKLHQYYIDAPKLDTQKLVWGAISGMVTAAEDPYTVFLPPKDNKDFKEDLGGAFEGIGAQLGLKDNRIVVIAPLKGNPAEAAGIRAGDYILKVNAEETFGWTVSEAVAKIRGPKGTAVKLNILHENAQKPVDLDIIRATVTVPSVISWIKSAKEVEEISGITGLGVSSAADRVAYIQLTRFGDHTNDEWLKAVREISSAKNVKGMVLDLRNNPGGYLDGAVFIASEFIGSGTVVSQVNSDGSRDERPVNRRGNLLNIPLVVVINKGSASASEIVAGALRDFGRAQLVGEISFGKGSVQTPLELSEGSSLHVTTGKWLLPKGDSISKTGIKPDLEILLENPTATQDAQLAKAIELLLK